jgi:hypothetical protein
MVNKLLLILMFLSGCARLGTQPKTPELKPPIEVEIPQSFITNGKLYVKVSLKPLVNLRAGQVAVDLIGISKGQESVKKSLALKDIVNEELLKANTPLVHDFELESANLDEYKVICRWAEEGVTPAEETKIEEKEAFTGIVELKDQTLVRSDCVMKDGICERIYTIQSKLKNSTAVSITDISIALEISFVPNGQNKTPTEVPALSALTAEEQEVKLEGLVLTPNEERPIEVRIPEPLVEIPDGMFVPRIRLFKYK